MHKIIKSILEKLENNGYEAYIIGGYVRDLLVGKESFDIDICTNATPRELIKIFPNSETKNLGGISFKQKEYHFEIMTYREEKKYENRKPTKYNYVSNLLVDLPRRDFTINAICMNKNGELIDLLNGIKDIKEKKIRMIGDITVKLVEDPLRILRGIRIATQLNFSIEKKLYQEMKKQKKQVLKLSNTRIKEELDKILLSDNVKKGFQYLEELGLISLLKITEYKDIVPVKNLEGMYAQINIAYPLPFTKVEKTNIKNLRKILKEKEITSQVLYDNGLYLCSIIAEIKKIDKRKINRVYKELPIRERKDMNINAEDIIKECNAKGEKIKILLKKAEQAILTKKISNTKEEIINYLKSDIR